MSYWVKLWAKVHKVNPCSVQKNGLEIRFCPVVAVSQYDYEFLQLNLQHPLMHVFTIDEQEYSALKDSAHSTAELENATSLKQLLKYIQRLKDFEIGRKKSEKRPKVAKQMLSKNNFSKRNNKIKSLESHIPSFYSLIVCFKTDTNNREMTTCNCSLSFLFRSLEQLQPHLICIIVVILITKHFVEKLSKNDIWKYVQW